MWSLVSSVVVAENVMQHVEERVFAISQQAIPLWLRYVDEEERTKKKSSIASRRPASSLQKKSNKMENFLIKTVW